MRNHGPFVVSAAGFRRMELSSEFEKVMKPVLDLFRKEREESTLLDMCPEFFASFMEKAESEEKMEENNEIQNKII